MPALTDRLTAEALATASAFWRWWTAELRATLPAGLRLPLSAAPSNAEIRLGRDRTEVVRTEKGVSERLIEPLPVSAFEQTNWAELVSLTEGFRPAFILEPPLTHALAIVLPKAARGRLSSAIPLQLRDHSPLEPALIDWAVSGSEPAGDMLRVRVLIARRTLLDQLSDEYKALSSDMPPIYADDAGRRTLLRGGSRHTWRPSTASLPWIIAAVILLLTPPLMLAALDITKQVVTAHVATLEEETRPVLRSEQWLRRRANVARAARTLAEIPTVSETVGTLASHLPQTSYAVSLAGRSDGALDMELVGPDPDAQRSALIGVRGFAKLHALDEERAPDGSAHVHYATGAR